MYVKPPKGQGGVYVIRLSETHFYGGSTKSFRGRWYEHLRLLKKGSHHNPHMQSVFDQYQHFEPEIVEIVQGGDRVLIEQRWLDTHFNAEGCVNICQKAESSPMEGRAHTPEARRKMSEANLGRPLSEEHRQKLSEVQKERHARVGVSLTTRAKLSLANSGRKSPHTSERNRSHVGWAHTPEARAKIGEASKGRKHSVSAETRAKISESLKGRTPSEETIRRRKETFKSRREALLKEIP